MRGSGCSGDVEMAKRCHPDHSGLVAAITEARAAIYR
jgi:hypothetical protein